MFGKKNKIDGPWGEDAAKHIKLLADNLKLQVMATLAEEKQISEKKFHSDVEALVKEVAQVIWHDCNIKNEMMRDISNPYTPFTWSKTIIKPSKTNPFELDTNGTIVKKSRKKRVETPSAHEGLGSNSPMTE